MAVSAEKPLFSAITAMTSTLSTMSTANCRTGTEVDNTTTRYRAVWVSGFVKMQGTPTLNTGVIEIWGLRNNGDTTPIPDGNYADNTAYSLALRPRGGDLLGVIACDGSATPTVKFNRRFRNPGRKWNVLIINSSGQTTDTTGGNSGLSWYGENPEMQ